MTFDDKVKKYIELRQKADELEKQISDLSSEIQEDFKTRDDTKYESGDYVLEYVTKCTTVYKDEPSIIAYLEENEPSLIQKSIIKTKLNSQLRDVLKHKPLVEALTPYYSTSITYYLKLSQKKADKD